MEKGLNIKSCNIMYWKNSRKPKNHTVQKISFSIKDYFRKCNQISRKLRIWSHLVSLMENFIFWTSWLNKLGSTTLEAERFLGKKFREETNQQNFSLNSLNAKDGIL